MPSFVAPFRGVLRAHRERVTAAGRRRRRRANPRTQIAVAAVLVGAAAACGATGTEPVSVVTEVKEGMLPARGAFWSGVYLGDAVSTPEKIGGALEAYAGMTGGQPALVKTFHHLDADLAPTGWSGKVLHAVSARGATNFVALDLDWPGRSGGSLLDAINRGDADNRIERVARALKQVNGTVLVEPAWEMNGNWNYTWQGVANGGDAQAPAKYVQAWRRVVDRFRALGVSNVRWVFNPNVGNAVGGPAAGPKHWNWYGHYYPGDGYVDFIGAHGYNAPVAFKSPYHTWEALFDGADADYMLRDMKQRFPTKPIIIGEMGAEETPGRDKGAWIRDAYARMMQDPRIVGAVWFNMNKEADWRINSSASALTAYREAMKAPVVASRYSDALLVADAGR